MEIRLIQTKIFLRLRNVKQLGLAHYVYPGADFSRFSHSLGVCHITGRILNMLNERKPFDNPAKEIQKYRLAALFHDIGHYPFSHAMEDAIKNYYSKNIYEEKGSVSKSESEETETKSFYSHEVLGKRILDLDPEIKALLQENDFEPKDISSIFRREGGHNFQNIISSDLDADRIDFLMRTACHTGLPFGNVDIDHIIAHIQVDKNGKLCLPRKVLKAAEHFLLCRYFDRWQVAYHKTVVALELVLKDVIEVLLDKKMIDCSKEELNKKLSTQNWSDFDDYHILNKIRDLKNIAGQDDTLALQVASILERNPPKLVGISEEFVGADAVSNKDTIELARSVRLDLSTKFNIDEKRIYLWHKIKNPITGFPSHISASQLGGENIDLDKFEQLIKILDGDGLNSRPITEVKSSLMSVLAGKNFTSIRFYILFKGVKEEARRAEVEKFIKTKIPSFNQAD